MSSINLHPTFNYSQPADYHFSHDSVFLARLVFEKHKDRLSENYRILDLCAGSGIIGLDFLFHSLNENINLALHVDFLEIQDVYRDHFLKNIQSLKELFPIMKTELNWISANYNQFKPDQKYDLILSNPPYFFPHQGKLSPNEFKNRCRFFIDATWTDFIKAIEQSLKPRGQAYFLVRDDLKTIIQNAGYENITFVSQIRGTWLGSLKIP